MNKKMLACAFVLSSAAFLQAAGAAAAEQPPEYSLDEMVITANRIPTPLAKTAANTTVITAAQIANGHYQSLGDVLRQVNGVIVGGGAFAGQNQGIRINGDDRVLILVDGVPIVRKEGAPTNGGTHSSLDLSTIVSLDNINRVEVVKGGASAMYGSDAVGGVVNIITKTGERNKSSLRTEFSSWGGTDYVFTNQGKEKDISWFFSYEKRHQDHTVYNSLTNGKSAAWPNSTLDSTGMTLRLDKEIDKDRSLTLNFQHSGISAGQPYSLSVAAYGSVPTVPTLWNNVSLSYNFDRSQAAPGFIRYYDNYFTMYNYGLYQSRTRGFQFQKGWETDAKNTLLAGADWQQGTVNNENGYMNKAISDTAFYIQDIWKPDAKWTLTPGLRYDNYTKFGGQITPKLQVNYGADAKTDFYASYNKVFRTPNLDDLYYKSSTASGNPNLQPETGRVITVGVNHRFNDSTSTQLSYFDSRLNNAIYWVGWPSSLATNVNEEKRGFEFTLKHDFSQKYYTEFGYSYLKIRGGIVGNSSADLAMLNAQPNGYRVGLGYHDAAWNIGLDGSSATGRNDLAFAGSSYWRWDLHADYKLNKTTKVYAKINNLTNTAYQIIATPPSMYSGIGDSPMPARNYQFGVQCDF